MVQLDNIRFLFKYKLIMIFKLLDRIDHVLLRFFEWIGHEFELLTGWDNFTLSFLVLGLSVLAYNIAEIYLSDDASKSIGFTIFVNLVFLHVVYQWYNNIVLPYRRRRTLWARNFAETEPNIRTSRQMVFVWSLMALMIGVLALFRVGRFPVMFPIILVIELCPFLSIAFYLICCTPLPPGDHRTVGSET